MKMELNQIYTYICVINALIKKEDMKSAMEIFKQMKLNDIKSDVVAYNRIIDGFSKQGDMKNAMKLFNQMKLNDIYPNVVTYSCIMHWKYSIK